MSHRHEVRTPRARWLPRVALGAAAGLAALACAGSPAAPTGTGLAVAVERGPLQPVSQPGQPNSAPVDGARLEITAAAGGEMVAASTDSAGSARVPLPAGSYRVSVLTCPGAMTLPAPAVVDVVAGSFTTLSLECDTGIR